MRTCVGTNGPVGMLATAIDASERLPYMGMMRVPSWVPSDTRVHMAHRISSTSRHNFSLIFGKIYCHLVSLSQCLVLSRPGFIQKGRFHGRWFIIHYVYWKKSKEISSSNHSNHQFLGMVCILGVLALTKKKDADISVISQGFYPRNSQGFPGFLRGSEVWAISVHGYSIKCEKI